MWKNKLCSLECIIYPQSYWEFPPYRINEITKHSMSKQRKIPDELFKDVLRNVRECEPIQTFFYLCLPHGRINFKLCFTISSTFAKQIRLKSPSMFDYRSNTLIRFHRDEPCGGYGYINYQPIYPSDKLWKESGTGLNISLPIQIVSH